jgi:glycosyltransferase involved in cell wall biosynthesis
MTTPSVVIVTSSFPMAGDGSEAAGSFVADLVDELAKVVHVKVVAPGPDAAIQQWSQHVEVYRYAAPSRALSTLKFWRPSDLWWIARVLRGGLRATRTATHAGAVHVLALWGLPCGEWVRIAARERGLDYSVWMLGSDVWSLGRLPVLRSMLGRVIRKAAHAYADGYQLADEARRIAGTSVRFLPSTRRIDIRDPAPPRDGGAYRLLFLGRWHPNKGVDLLLDALAMLGDDDWRLIESVQIQGGGPLDAVVRELASALIALGRPVEVGRYLTKPEAEAAIAAADWVLIPSRIESIPVIFSDAVKLGRPVVVMPVGDLPALLGRHAIGVVADDVSSAAYAGAIQAALRQSASSHSLALSGCAREFNLGMISASLIKSFQAGGATAHE